VASGEARRLCLASLFQMTMPGAPGIYYGDEVGMLGGHDPDCRRAFPWHAPESWNTGLLDTIRSLSQMRRAHPALRRGTWRLLWAGEESFAFERACQGERIVVLINRGRAPDAVELALDVAVATTLWGEGQTTVQDGVLTIKYSHPWSGMILLCSQATDGGTDSARDRPLCTKDSQT
jgi:cyclomaltodextrinase